MPITPQIDEAGRRFNPKGWDPHPWYHPRCPNWCVWGRSGQFGGFSPFGGPAGSPLAVVPVWPVSGVQRGCHLIASDMLHLLQGSRGAPRVPPSARSQQHVPSHPPASVTPPTAYKWPKSKSQTGCPLAPAHPIARRCCHTPKAPQCQKKPRNCNATLPPAPGLLHPGAGGGRGNISQAPQTLSGRHPICWSSPI